MHMGKALARPAPHEAAPLPGAHSRSTSSDGANPALGAHPRSTSSGGANPALGAQETALRLALEEARQLAAQSGLLALNAALESAGAGEDMAALAGSAGQAASDAERIVGAVELLLQQIHAAAAVSRPL
jgi:hypothetical protein